MIWIGTSGYSFDDWGGAFYPRGVKPGDRLNYYATRFRAVEVNTTYYRLPHPVVLAQMEKKTPPGFRFVVKMHQDVTHKRSADDAHFRAFLDVIRPLEDAGKFNGALAQFPYSFRCTRDALGHLDRIRERMGERPVFIEFRHDSWARDGTFDHLRKAGLGFCVVDEPRLPGLFPPMVRETNGVGYVRFHGRNEQNWWGGGGDRYDYDYPDRELLEWVDSITELGSRTTDTYLFFNNCHAGRAARNARRMAELLGIAGPSDGLEGL
jgi:uncharacterized protein YecE (DUF72 family)